VLWRGIFYVVAAMCPEGRFALAVVASFAGDLGLRRALTAPDAGRVAAADARTYRDV